MEVEGFIGGPNSREYTMSLAVGGVTASSGRARFRIIEFEYSLRNSSVKTLVVAWDMLTDVRFGLEPGYLVYHNPNALPTCAGSGVACRVDDDCCAPQRCSEGGCHG
jgi:hypothetical protein